jgi:DNA-3-methyladenine glycosylase
VGSGALTAADLRAVLAEGPLAAAPALLGCTLSAGGVTVRIVEVEAYAGVGEDPGSHAHRGRTGRNEAMFGEPGTLYVYFTYGMHWCANVVTGPVGYASAVLLRAGRVTDGTELARERRGRPADRDLARGPARLAQALGLDRTANASDLIDGSGPALLQSVAAPPTAIGVGPRTGVAGDGALTPWRFWLEGDGAVSAYRAATKRARPAGSGRTVVRRTGGSSP